MKSVATTELMKSEGMKVVEMTLADLFEGTLKDIYFAERKILASLPKMVKAAQSTELKLALEKHRQQTEVHVERLVQVFNVIGVKPAGKTCAAINGILEDGANVIEEFKDTSALDAGMVAAAQAVEHYEITRYGTLKRWAQVLGLPDAVKLLDMTLREESQTDTDLSGLADQVANPKAKGP
jgi:ferritin-like metal-binding protein YciE